MSPPQGPHDTFPQRSFESVIVGYILSQESYVTAPFGRLLSYLQERIFYMDKTNYSVARVETYTKTSITKDETRLNNILAKTRNIIDLNKINKELEEYGCTLTSKEYLEYLKDGLEEIEI